jgi:hypothetical protein
MTIEETIQEQKVEDLHRQFAEETGDDPIILKVGNIYYHTAYVRWLERKLTLMVNE